MVGEFAEVSLNCTFSGTVPVVGVPEKPATGAPAGAVTVMRPVFETVLEPPALPAVRLTVQVPAVVYV
jgi:hypothetical protein